MSSTVKDRLLVKFASLTQKPLTPNEELRRHLECDKCVKLCSASRKPSALPKPNPACSRRTHRVASAPAVELLAPAFGQALPSLAGVLAAYSHSQNTDTLLELCRVLVEHDLGDKTLWNSSGK